MWIFSVAGMTVTFLAFGMALIPFPCFLSGGPSHFRCPTLGTGAVLPPLHGVGSVLEGELQKIIVVGCNRRYFARMPNQGNGLHQLFLRDGFGGAVGFAVGIVGGADPDRSRGSGFAAVVLVAYGASDKSVKGDGCCGLVGAYFRFLRRISAWTASNVSCEMMASWVSAA